MVKCQITVVVAPEEGVEIEAVISEVEGVEEIKETSKIMTNCKEDKKKEVTPLNVVVNVVVEEGAVGVEEVANIIVVYWLIRKCRRECFEIRTLNFILSFIYIAETWYI